MTRLLILPLYGGRGNWTAINGLDEMPEAVGQRLADLMQQIY